MNHIADANKMVSDTPRTDEAVWQIEGGEMVCPKFCRQLERELNAANAKIKRLEEAGDALKASGYFGGWGDAVNKWVKVREGKP